MRWNIIAVGKPSLPWARQAVEDYSHRISRVTPFTVTYLKDAPADVLTSRVLAATDGTLRIIMDERGRALRSTQLATWISTHQMDGTKSVSLIIGGANGHTPGIKEAAQESWTLSSFTLQHELALVVLLEQIYRAHTILQGSPYHRE